MENPIAKLIALAAIFIGGCIGDTCCESEPIVSPTNISTEVQPSDDPFLPQYVPWWVQEF